MDRRGEVWSLGGAESSKRIGSGGVTLFAKFLCLFPQLLRRVRVESDGSREGEGGATMPAWGLFKSTTVAAVVARGVEGDG